MDMITIQTFWKAVGLGEKRCRSDGIFSSISYCILIATSIGLACLFAGIDIGYQNFGPFRITGDSGYALIFRQQTLLSVAFITYAILGRFTIGILAPALRILLLLITFLPFFKIYGQTTIFLTNSSPTVGVAHAVVWIETLQFLLVILLIAVQLYGIARSLRSRRLLNRKVENIS